MIRLSAHLPVSPRWFVLLAALLLAPVAGAQKASSGFILRGHRAAVLALEFSPDGRFLVSGSADRTMRLWNLQTKRSAYTLSGHTDAVTAVGFASDGSHIVSGSLDSRVLFWSFDTGRRNNGRGMSTSGPVSSMKISPDGKRIAIGTTEGKLYCADTGVGGGNIIERAHRGRVTQIFWIPDTKRFWSNGDDGQWRVWNMQKGLLKAAKGAASQRQGTLEKLGNQPVAISPDQRTIAVAKTVTQDGRNAAQLSLLQWPSLETLISGSANKGHFVPTLHALAFSPDGLTLAGAGDDGTIYFWDVSWLNTLHERKGSAPRVAELPDDEDEPNPQNPVVADSTATTPANPLMSSAADARWPALTKRPIGGEHHGGTTGLTIINNDTVSIRVAVRLRKAGKTSTEGVDAVLHTDRRRNKEYFVLPEGEYDVFYAKLLEPGIIYQLEKPARIYTYEESLPNGYRIMAHNPEITLTPQAGNVRVLRVK